jgi:hemolysin activation/secretion protein
MNHPQPPFRTPMRALASSLVITTGLVLTPAFAQSLTFPIERFQIEGNSLLTAEQISTLVTPFQGQGKSFAEVQLALEALERAYRALGYSAVAVTLPEQDISAGTVRFNVVEARLGDITVAETRHYSQDNILRSLPSLRSGDMPNAIAMTQNLALANENPGKQAEITLRISDKPGLVNADVKVEESPPQRTIVGLDNTGKGSTTGDWRVSLGWQHANLFDRDHTLSLQYTTSPEKVSQVTLLNLGYRVPLYGWGDSVDFYAGTSNVDAGSFGAGSGIDGFVGKGQVAGVRYNLNLARRGEYSHAVKGGLDWKYFDNDCTGLACGAVGADVVATPWNANYQGTWTRPGAQSAFAITYVQNTSWGHLNKDSAYANATHQPAPPFGAKRSFSLWRLNASHISLLRDGYQSRVNLAAQYTRDPLIAGEQIGLVGSTVVRGFNEREFSRDQGHVLNLEIYTPEVAKAWGVPVDSLRALVFLDHAAGRFVRAPGETDSAPISVTSIGWGLRLTHRKDYQIKFDWARVADDALANAPTRPWVVHLSMIASF